MCSKQQGSEKGSTEVRRSMGFCVKCNGAKESTKQQIINENYLPHFIDSKTPSIVRCIIILCITKKERDAYYTIYCTNIATSWFLWVRNSRIIQPRWFWLRISYDCPEDTVQSSEGFSGAGEPSFKMTHSHCCRRILHASWRCLSVLTAWQLPVPRVGDP